MKKCIKQNDSFIEGKKVRQRGETSYVSMYMALLFIETLGTHSDINMEMEHEKEFQIREEEI